MILTSVGRTVTAWLLAAVALGWGVVILAAPMAGAPRLTAASYVMGALVCHQRPERSFHLAGAQLPVCARCAALYWAGAAGLVGWLFVRRRTAISATLKGGPPSNRGAPRDGGPAVRTLAARAIFIAAVPVVVTVATATVGLWDPGNVARALLSAPLGLAIGAVLAAVVRGDLR